MAGRKNLQPFVMGALAAMVPVYFLSYPFWICWGSILSDVGMNPPLVKAASTFYTPASWVLESLPPYEWYIRNVTERHGIYLAHQE